MKTLVNLLGVTLLFSTVIALAQTCDNGRAISRSTTCSCGETVQVLACEGVSGTCQSVTSWVQCGTSCYAGSSSDGCSPLGLNKSRDTNVLSAKCNYPPKQNNQKVGKTEQADFWIQRSLLW